MAWMDAPPCGPQACEGEHAGDAIISNMHIVAAEEMNVGEAVADAVASPTPNEVEMTSSWQTILGTKPSAFVWVVSDPEDELFEQVVPEEISKDGERLFRVGDNHLVRWKRAMHLVRRVERPINLTSCGPGLEVPCKIHLSRDVPSWSEMFVRRYDDRPLSGSMVERFSGPGGVLKILCCALVLGVALAVVLRRVRRPAKFPQEFMRAPASMQGFMASYTSPMKYSRLEAGGFSPMQRDLAQQASSPLGTMESVIETSPARLRTSALRLQRERSL